MDKIERMNRLRAKAQSLKNDICDPSVRLVWGEGSLDSRVVIVGEAPAVDEDQMGRPFVGRVGRFLDKELEIAGIERRLVYITNTLKCWSVKLKGARRINRPPANNEIEAWSDVLLRELEIIHPSVVLCLGNVAASVLVHRPFVMTKERGIWFDGPYGTHVMATFHPAYVARFGGMSVGVATKQFRRDLTEIAAEVKPDL